MKKDEVVRARIEADLKADAERLLAESGLDLSNAIRLFLRQVVQHRGLPFPLKPPGKPDVLQPAQLDAAKRERQRAERARPASVARFFIAPAKARAARVKWAVIDYDD